MSVNGITSAASPYANTVKPSNDRKVKENEKVSVPEESGVVYEKSANATDGKSGNIADYSAIISNLKQELSTKNAQLEALVSQLLGKQATKVTKLADLFKNLTADPATIAQAQKDISEDGYWGVEQTSDRLVSMAQALSGGNPEKADEMIAAMKKGFEQATGDWGEELPDICRQTIDAAVEKMENWRDGITVTD